MKNWIIPILFFLGVYFYIDYTTQSNNSHEDYHEYYYSYYDAVGNKVIINLNDDKTGTIRMEYAKTSSGLEEFMSEEPVACSWYYYKSSDYLHISSRHGDIYIRDGYAYFDYTDVKSKDIKRGCKLN